MPIIHCYFYPLWQPSVRQKCLLSQHVWWRSVSHTSFSLSHSICLSECHSTVAWLSIKPVSLPVPQPSFWSPCPSTASLICSSVFFTPFFPFGPAVMGPSWKHSLCNRSDIQWLNLFSLTCPRLPWSHVWYGKRWKWAGGKHHSLSPALSHSLSESLF